MVGGTFCCLKKGCIVSVEWLGQAELQGVKSLTRWEIQDILGGKRLFGW